jgi:CBS domain-containing protein
MRRVKDILAIKGQDIWSVGPDISVYDAIHLLAEKEIGALIVMQNDKLVGVISERDYARQIILKEKSSKKTLVGEIMTKKVVTASPDQDVSECMALMTDKRIRHLPIVANDEVVGVISIGDLIRAVISEQQSTIVDLEKYISS